ncbi:hypothetical protein [Vibrio sp. CAU 1672]|uniref:hypothetical protein n=1 Tax=Vibrio sp. CAU 1672 TaxID=3032594 RepID=UPI0023D9D24F|nr:hypothetical protein [Vibrio sp. CAU 1672]MDF2155949.1 hypothetical protein [Vibrio sp. CAU 1672]
MKKFALLLAAIPCAVMAANDATDLSLGMAVDQQLSVVIELDNQYRGIIGNEGIAFDYIAQSGRLGTNAPVSWYVGVGGWYEWDDPFGVRVPLGLNWDLSKGWDLYAQLHPELKLYKGPELQLGAALGVKYRF